MKPPPDATRVETYLAAIHEELSAIRVALVDGGAGQDSTGVTAPVDDQAPAAASPTKRTRTRNR